MGFYLDAPISHSTSAYDKANRSRSTTLSLSSSKSKKTPALLGPIKRKARKLLGGSDGPSSALSVARGESIRPTPAKQSRLFRLPLSVREKIYGYIIGQDELLHILLRYRSAPARRRVAYRRCRAHGDVENCVLKDCKEFYDFRKGSYFGYFDHVSGLFLTCRDIYKESSQVLYSQNTLEFDHPLSLIILSRDVSSSSLHSIRSISIDLQRRFYAYGIDNFNLCTSLHPDQWLQMWNSISGMHGLEEIRVKFRLLVDGWMGWTENEVLEPLYKVTQPLKVFEVEMPSASRNIASKCDNEREIPFKLVKY